MAAPVHRPALGHTQAWFTTTQWSLVFLARNHDSPVVAAAREKLCQIYWPPIYAFIRRRGHKPQDAQDLTQEFFRRFLEKEWLNRLKDQRGKFRSFLLTFVKNFLSEEWARANAQKRGGGKMIIPIDAFESEEAAFLQLADKFTPEQHYERVWAQSLISRAVERLRCEYAEKSKLHLFEHLRDSQLAGRGELSLAELGKMLGMSETAVKVAAHRFRNRYAELLRDEIAQTVTEQSSLEEEYRNFIAAFNP